MAMTPRPTPRRIRHFEDGTGRVSPAPRLVHSRSDGRALFDDAEALAILIGGRDPLSHFPATGRSARFCALLFGVRTLRPLADPRLEALRRLVLDLRRRPRRIERAAATALVAGISADQIDALLTRYADVRALSGGRLG